MVEFDPELMRQLATDVRKRADAITGKVPVAETSRDAARCLPEGTVGMKGSQIAITVEETVSTLDNVVRYHVARLRQIADSTDKAATLTADMDDSNARSLRKAERR